MAHQSPLYLGFDLSTQQLKCLAVTSDLKVVYEAVSYFSSPLFPSLHRVLSYETRSGS